MFDYGVHFRDIALALALLGIAGIALRRPWLGVLGLAVLSFLHPQAYAPGFMRVFPSYASLFVLTLASAGLAFARGRLEYLPPRALAHDWRIYALLGLWLWFAVSSYYALLPPDAWTKFRSVANILPPLALALLLIDDRRKLHALIVIVAISITLIAVKGGYWALVTGFNDRVYGPPYTQYHDNNHFAVAICMAIPLLAIWLRETHDRIARALIMLCLLLSYVAALSSWSRGGMLALVSVTLLLVLRTSRKWLWIPALLLLAIAMFTLLPEDWFGRMRSLENLAADQSAQNRLAVWRIGLDLAMDRPITGGGFNAWPILTLDQGNIDWHSSYIKLLAEHGFPGLLIWLGLMLGSLFQLARAAWLPLPGYPAWASANNAMFFASLLAYLIGGATLGIAYWELPYLLIILAILTHVFAKREMAVPSTAASSRSSMSNNFTETRENPRENG
ncbi:MAG: putative O-glycosylation ligase, exosortase A system-associated [Pseudomonadota bacterium]|nr:putative O-glycosylation ligase, exosortase A system-associated [Pseudomonadota bacterium]MDP1905120.1 putative O-glycosylation ligase, exosortase A system-associated [Pseudomonadota bacterium]MDP2351976.1 putative O-glycosylation ligase, exosortase A system-associated [Pseudomonadota bacterium]